MDEALLNETKAFREEFRSEALKAEKIFVVCHIGPDDDAIGSLLASYFYLTEKLGIEESRVKALCTGKRIERYSVFEGYDKVEFVRDIAKHVEKGFVLFLDGSLWKRFSGEEKQGLGFSACIDHHETEGEEHDLSIIKPGFSSTAELVYHVFFREEENISKKVCEALLLGILGDTGNFSYVSRHNKSVLRVAETLIEKGDIHIQEFEAKYNFVMEESFRLFRKLVANSRIENKGNWPRLMYSYVDDAKEDFDVVKEAAQMFIRYTRKIKGVHWGFVVTPRNSHCSVSLRALPGSVNVRKVAEEFSGGGHDLAAGCGFDDVSCSEAKDLLLKWLEDTGYEGYRHRS